ncbi:MAG TPA: hypothetical protein PK990_05620 [Salinivirgaceae bacterium]|nr:hypothetical protein [Salinivirgaceae bacterium]
MKIHFIPEHKIDRKQWQQLSEMPNNNFLYNQSWYLDAITNRNWGALVDENYTAALPLPYRKKFGIPYLFQPFLTQQFSLLCHSKANQETLSAFIKKIPSRFLIANLSLNQIPSKLNGFNYIERTNHILDLNKDYEQIASEYNRNTRRNIQAAKAQELAVEWNLPFDDFLPLQIEWEPGNFTKPHKNILLNLWPLLQQHAEPFTVCVYFNSNPCAVGLFCRYGSRIYFMLCASSSEGKDTKAMFLLIDRVIERFSGSELLFDFTGSSIPDIARRNVGFGASTEIYFALQRSNLLQKTRDFLIKRLR